MGNQPNIRQPSVSARDLTGTSLVGNGTFNNQTVSVIRHKQLMENINNTLPEQKGNYIPLRGKMEVNITEGVATLTINVPTNYIQIDKSGNWQFTGKLNIVDGNGNLHQYYNNKPSISLQPDPQQPGQYIIQAQFKRQVSFSEHMLSNNYSISYNSMNEDKGFTGMIGFRYNGNRITPWAGVGVDGFMGKVEVPLNKDFSKNPEAALLRVGVVLQQNNIITHNQKYKNETIVRPKLRAAPQIRF